MANGACVDLFYSIDLEWAKRIEDEVKKIFKYNKKKGRGSEGEWGRKGGKLRRGMLGTVQNFNGPLLRGAVEVLGVSSLLSLLSCSLLNIVVSTITEQVSTPAASPVFFSISCTKR